MDMFERPPGDGEGQGSLASCSPWDHKELDTPEWLNNDKYFIAYYIYFKHSPVDCLFFNIF